MKKFLLVLAVTFLFIPAAFAEEVNLADMDYEQLFELKQAVDLEFSARSESEPKIFTSGRYVVGEAIKAGTYNITVADFGNEPYGNMYVYENADKEAEYESLIGGRIRIGESVGVTLEDGNIFSVGDLPLKLSVEPFEADEMLSYTPPEGTLIPAGTYRGGVEIPVGTYQVFPSSLKPSWIYVYNTEEKYKEDESSSFHHNHDVYLEIYVKRPEELTTLTVSEGNVLVFDGNAIMTKYQSEQFVFD